MNKKTIARAVLLAGFLAVMAAAHHTQTFAASNASISLERDKGSGYLTLTVSDPDGIKEFALFPSGKSSYGGELQNCKRTFTADNITYLASGDLIPALKATIVDCRGNSVDLELPPLKDGKSRGVEVVSKQAPAEPGSTNPSVQEKSAPVESRQRPKASLLANIQFPVKELGGCQSEVECVAYCDDASNAKACLSFAKEHNLLPLEEIERAEKLADMGEGPGGCNSQKSCEAYCNDVSRINECLSFAEENGFLSGRELDEAKKIQSFINAGEKLPGNCHNKAECEAYCNDPDNAEECIDFGEKSGFLDAKEIKNYRKFLELQQKGETPGNCTTRESCEAYCNSPDNMDECLTFAEKTGFISDEELEMARRFAPLLKEGKTPGGCRNKTQCEAYCDDSAHTDECVTFAVNAGLVSKEDAEIIKKTGGKGPGNCHSKEQCEEYCQEHSDECEQWAKDNGIQVPEGQGGAAGFSGPGGCKSEEECKAYCESNPDECKNFAPPGGKGLTGGFPGGGGDGFSACGIVEGAPAVFVCAINGRGAAPGVETTYFNECHAKQHGAQILHEGVCKGHSPCSDVAHPVCGTDGSNYTDECIAKEHAAGVKHAGVCTSEDNGIQVPEGQGGAAGFSGPGGCKSTEECTAYCQTHYATDPACGGTGGPLSPPQPPTAPPRSPEPSPPLEQSPPSGGQIPPEYCSSFVSAPSCSYVGSPDSDNYKYCKQCFPDK